MPESQPSQLFQRSPQRWDGRKWLLSIFLVAANQLSRSIKQASP